ncbi:MAG TPA: bifunctional riboflavin kinase/FAD synthetase [Afifellaceae bacterium]|nr:bifunctional riboflavin kinase/FAD synthetase [Afifellaceae bacterium]
MTPDRAGPVLARFDALPAAWRGAVVAIGNFDGVHTGHQVVLAAAKAEAERESEPLVMLTFEPHPRTLFQPDSPVFRLTDETVKAAVACACGVDGVLVLPFDAALSAMSADDFVSRILIDRLAIRHAVTGYDFHFGHKRQGTPDFLRQAGVDRGFGVTIVAEHGDEGGAVSSSRIRDRLSDGDIAEANRMLGWAWSVSGEVLHGEKRGRDLGYPTANMTLDPACRLRHGIYAVRFTRADGTVHDGVASYGRRPMFDNGRPLLETHMFDFDGDIYGETVLATLQGWIRPEAKFESVDALVAQMHRDSAEARDCLKADPASAVDEAVRDSWLRITADAERHVEHI